MGLAPGAHLGNYEILSRLGVGAMGEVYRAKDRKLGRDVAIKVLPEEVASDPERLRRFEREARSASALNHPNIVTIHEIGEADGTHYIAMECVEGRTLRALIAEGPFVAKEWLSVATQIAEGLARAHAAAIIHRDLKPANIMVTSEGLVKILDFGLAKHTPVSKLLGELGTWTVELTTEGALVGTVPYMSPEQASGRAVDHHSDQFSLGLVLYEMAAGRPAFTRATATQTLAAIIEDEPEPLSSVAPLLSGRSQAIVMRCLAKDPSQRFGSTTDLVRELKGLREPRAASWATAPRRYIALLAVLGLLAVAGALALRTGVLPGWLRGDRSASVPTGTRTLAVLPFENLGASEDDHFADGITDEVRGKLAMLSGLQVIASTSSNQYKRTTKTPQQIAGELSVQFLLVGRIRWEKKSDSARRVRVSPELVQVANVAAPTTRWQQTFDVVIEDVFQVQSAIAGEVARGLEVRLAEGEPQRLAAIPTENLAAYVAYLQGNEAADEFAGESPVAVKQAIAHYERAVALDERFGHAWAMLSRAYSTLLILSTADPAYRERAKSAAERALALDPALPAARLAMGNYYEMRGKGFRDAALEQYQLGLRYAPSDSQLLRSLADWLSSAGRWDEALTVRRRVRALDPRSAAMVRLLADTLLWQRRYAEAREAAEAALRLDSRSFPNLAVKTMVQLAQGDLAGARAVLKGVPQDVDRAALAAYMANFWDLYWVLDDADEELLLRLTPASFGDDRLDWAMSLAQTADLQGDAAAARRYAEEARLAGERITQTHPDAVWKRSFLGLAYAYLGRKEEAIRNGERGLSLMPLSEDAYVGAYSQHYLARIYLRVGQPDRALDLLEDLLQRPCYLSRGWLRIDPEWRSLREHPRFRRLTADH